MTTARQTLGTFGEQHASDHLKRNGYAILDRNVRLPSGELDIMAKERDTFVLVEVRTKASKRFGTGEESITPKKQRTLTALAYEYAEAHPEAYEKWRLDLIAIDVDRAAGIVTRLAHYKHAIDEPDEDYED